MKTTNRNIFYTLVLIIATSVSLQFVELPLDLNSSTAEAQSQVPNYPAPNLKLGDSLPNNLFIELAKAINPAVVNISTSSIPQRRGRMRDPMLDLLEQFYGFPLVPPGSDKPQQMSLGTGFIIRDDGLIVTNNHVIEGADIINVQLIGNKKTFEAKLIGSDKRSDIALIKIDTKQKLPVAPLGSSKDIQVGEWVAAFGNPFGHDHTVTKGIISSLGREINEINKYPLIQTDASINPGNSGGPLVNTKGLVIGVNSAIDARAQGIGFAIPIDQVKAIIPQLESRGNVQKGYIGVQMGALDPYTLEKMDIDGGAVIVDLERGGPAYKAGIKHYDIITEFNGREIKDPIDLQDAVADSPVGKDINVVVLRNQKKLNLKIKVIERKEERVKASKPNNTKKFTGTEAPYELGFSIADLTDEIRDVWGLPKELKKPIIVDIDKEGGKGNYGLQVGDVLLNVNNKDVETVKEAVKAFKKDTNILRLARNGRIVIIQIDTK